MNRLQKKCVVASASMHLLLVVILVVGPAFLSSSRKANDLATLDAIPSKVIDEAFSGGGESKVKPPPANFSPPAPAPPPPPPPRIPQREPPKIAEHQPTDSLEPAPDQSKKHKLDINLTPVTHHVLRNTNDSRVTEREERAMQAAEERRREMAMAAINRAARGLKEDVANSTAIDVDPGHGGGESYANYGQLVKSIYEQAWIPPEDVSGDNPVALVSVTIASDGTVIDAHVVQPSGEVFVDNSVKRTLDRVRKIAPFPEGAKENQRSYKIKFDLKAKRLAG